MYDNEDDYDMIFKVLIIGDSGVGKSNLLLRFVKNEFMSDMRSTVGVEFGSKLMKIDDFNVKAQIWDTAGQERYRSITSAYYKGAKGVLIVYDITRKDTFKNLDKWLNDFKMKCDDDASIVIVGNKSDLNENREVEKAQGEEKAKEHNLAFFETSAKDNENVNSAFTELMTEIVKTFKNNMDENFTKNDKTKTVSKGKEISTQGVKLDGHDAGGNGGYVDKSKKCCK